MTRFDEIFSKKNRPEDGEEVYEETVLPKKNELEKTPAEKVIDTLKEQWAAIAFMIILVLSLAVALGVGVRTENTPIYETSYVREEIVNNGTFAGYRHIAEKKIIRYDNVSYATYFNNNMLSATTYKKWSLMDISVIGLVFGLLAAISGGIGGIALYFKTLGVVKIMDLMTSEVFYTKEPAHEDDWMSNGGETTDEGPCRYMTLNPVTNMLTVPIYTKTGRFTGKYRFFSESCFLNIKRGSSKTLLSFSDKLHHIAGWFHFPATLPEGYPLKIKHDHMLKLTEDVKRKTIALQIIDLDLKEALKEASMRKKEIKDELLNEIGTNFSLFERVAKVTKPSSSSKDPSKTKPGGD